MTNLPKKSTMSAITVRPATADDLPAIAQLLTQLYAAELPGALSGSPEGQTRVLQFTLETNNQRGLHRRYVACNEAGQVIATAALEVPDEPPYERAPDGTIGMALKAMGVGPTLRLLLVVARNMFGGYQHTVSDAAFLHSFVVDERQRGQGIGRSLMDALEARAQAEGYGAMRLQVLAANQTARRLYAQLGYQPIWQSPAWSRLIALPSYVLQKQLGP